MFHLRSTPTLQWNIFATSSKYGKYLKIGKTSPVTAVNSVKNRYLYLFSSQPNIVLQDKTLAERNNLHCSCLFYNNNDLFKTSPVKLQYKNRFYTTSPKYDNSQTRTDENGKTKLVSPLEESTGNVKIPGNEPQETISGQSSIFKRFKDAYKEYGKVLIGVHVVTSVFWYGGFFYAAQSGLDVVPLLQSIGAGETIIKPFRSGAGHLAVAYLLYKIATPARYTVTLFGTQVTVKQLRKIGYMEPPAAEDSIRNLMKDSRTQIKDRIDDIKDNVDDMTDKFKDNIDKLKDNKDKFKGSFKGKVEEYKDKRQHKKL